MPTREQTRFRNVALGPRPGISIACAAEPRPRLILFGGFRRFVAAERQAGADQPGILADRRLDLARHVLVGVEIGLGLLAAWPMRVPS